MLIYNFDSSTKEYIGASEASPNPMSPGEYFVSAYATQLEPPTTEANQVAVFNSNNNDPNLISVGDTIVCPDAVWEIKPDYRGTVVYTELGVGYTIEKIGEVVDTTNYLTLEELNSKLVKESTFNFTTRKWVINVPALKVALITKAGEYKYELQESMTISNEIFSNKTATYNYNLHVEAINMYKAGIPVRWRNLDGSRVDITDENLPKLEELLASIRIKYQNMFAAFEIVETEIKSITDSAVLINYNVKNKLDAALVSL